ncbi:MAG: hypothetical protein ACOC00_05295 [Halothiobacillaceae bacterium]
MQSDRHPLSLTFRHRAVLIIGALMFVFGTTLAWFMLQHEVRLTCDRPADECVREVIHAAPIPSRTDRFPVSAIEGARVRQSTSSSSNGSSTTYRAQLETRDGRLSLSAYGSSSRGEHQALANAVENFLKTDQPRLVLHHRPGWLLAGILGIFPVIGLLMTMGLRTVVQVRVDTGSGLLVLDQRRWWQSSGRTLRLPLEQIADIRVQSSRGVGSSGNRGTHRVVIEMKDGTQHPLYGFSSGGKGAFRREARLRELLIRAGIRPGTSADLSDGRA